MGREHGPEGHVTKTFGQRLINLDIMMWVFRLGAKRTGATDAQKLHAGRVLERWLNRWCRREAYTYSGIQVSAVGDPVPDAIILSALVGRIPEDWVCFAGIIEDVIGVSVNGPMPDLSFMMALPGLGPDDEDTPKRQN